MFKAYLIEEDKLVNLVNIVLRDENVVNIIFRDENDRLDVASMDEVKLLQNTNTVDDRGIPIYQGDVLVMERNGYYRLELIEFKSFSIKDDIKSGFHTSSTNFLYLKEIDGKVVKDEYIYLARNLQYKDAVLTDKQKEILKLNGINRLGNIYEDKNLRLLFKRNGESLC